MVRRVVAAAALASACADATGPLSIQPTSVTLTIGTRQQLELLAAGRPVAPRPGEPITWTSSDTAVLLVNPAGEALGQRGGSSRVTAGFSGHSATITVTVIPTAAGIWLTTAADSFYVFQLNEIRNAGSPTGVVSGSVTMQVGSQNDSVHYFDATGTHIYPSVEFRLTRRGATGSPEAIYTGSFENDTSIVGRRTGQGPAARDLKLTRPTCYCPLFAPGATPGRLAPGELQVSYCCTRG